MTDKPIAKPLFWRKGTDHPQDNEGQWVADGIGGRYSAHKQRDGTWLLWWAHDGFIWEACADLAELKRKAEADWQKRFAERLYPENGPCLEDGGFIGPALTTKVQEASTLTASSECPICHLSFPHHHSSRVVDAYQNKRSRA